METPQNYNDILARVNDFHATVKEAKAKEAGATKVPETDPRNQGEKSIPNLEETDDTNKTNNDKSTEDAKLEDESTHPVSTGKNVPSTQDGNAKEDAFTSPTTPLGKIASIADRVKAVESRIKNFSNQPATKQAGSTTPVKKEEGSNPTGSKAANTDLAGDYSDEFLRKLAFAICETEGGLDAVEPVLLKHAGQEEARELMNKAAAEYDQLAQMSEQFEHEQMQKLAYEQASLEAAQEMLKNASEEDREQILKVASAHNEQTADYQDEFLKAAYMGGAEDAAAMMDAEEAMPEGAEEEVGLPGAAQGEPSIEEIVQLLDAMVSSGEIDEQTATQVIEQLAGGGEMGGEEVPMDPAMLEEGGAPMDPAMLEGAPEEGMIAQASDNADLETLYKELITIPA